MGSLGRAVWFTTETKAIGAPRSEAVGNAHSFLKSWGVSPTTFGRERIPRSRLARLLELTVFSLVLLLWAAPAVRAVPIVYDVNGGYVDIAVRLGGVTIGSTNGVALIGDSITVDAAALTLDAIRLDIAPTTITLSEHFGGYDQIVVESALIEGDIGFSTITAIGIPTLFTAVAGSLTVTGSWGASDSLGVSPTVSGNLITFPVVSVIAVVNANPAVELDSVTINSIDGTPFGHPGEHLTIVATYVVETPEPTTGLLLTLGLLLMLARRSKPLPQS